MMAEVRMWAFHLRLFASNSYFSQLLVTSTLSVFALQWLASRHQGADPDALIWLRAGMVGTWTVCTVAVGMVGFQRFQGTLIHLVATPRPVARTMVPLIASAATFGLAAFPLAAVLAAVSGAPLQVGSWGALVGGVALLWVGCLALSSAIAAVFVLTPNAITYEGLLAIPLILLSGVFGLPAATPSPVIAITHLLPTTGATTLVSSAPAAGGPGLLPAATSAVASLCWFAFAGVLLRRATARAIHDGTLELV